MNHKKFMQINESIVKKVDVKRIDVYGNCGYVYITGKKDPVVLKENTKASVQTQIDEIMKQLI